MTRPASSFVVVPHRDTASTNGYYLRSEIVREYKSRRMAERFADSPYGRERNLVVRASHFVAASPSR